MSKYIKAPYPYHGNKKKEMIHIHKHIQHFIDTHPSEELVFIDLFTGSGLVSLYVLKHFPQFKKVIMNDINKAIYNIYNVLRSESETDELIQLLESVQPCEKTFYDIKNDTSEYVDHKYYDILKFYYLAVYSFKGTKRIYDRTLRTTKCRSFSYLKSYIHEFDLNKLVIKNFNFSVILDEYKTKNDVLIYADPPYIAKTTTQYGVEFTLYDLNILKDTFKEQCSIILNLDYTGYTRENYKEYFIEAYTVQYGIRKNEDIYKKYHLILSNLYTGKKNP